MRVHGLACAGCGAQDLIAIAPGEEAQRCDWGDFPLTRARPETAWCEAHWPFLRDRQSAEARP